MISIDRAPCPEELAGKSSAGDHYGQGAVVARLWRMQHEKCCYCEQKIPRYGQGRHVEHFRPKEDKRFAKLRNKWENLLLACPQCNGEKGIQFPISGKRALLIDPSSRRIDPEDHIDFATGEVKYEPPFAVPKNGSPRGKVSIKVIGLSSIDHVRERWRFLATEVLPKYEELLAAHNAGNQAECNQLREDFKRLMSSNSRYAGFARAFARNRFGEILGLLDG